MRIYSSRLTGGEIVDAGEGILRAAVQPIRSAKLRAQGWNVAAMGSTSNRWKNTGNRGASALKAPTWDQYGHWFARLFTIDPDALIVAARRYDGAADFHHQTGQKYR